MKLANKTGQPEFKVSIDHVQKKPFNIEKSIKAYSGWNTKSFGLRLNSFFLALNNFILVGPNNSTVLKFVVISKSRTTVPNNPKMGAVGKIANKNRVPENWSE